MGTNIPFKYQRAALYDIINATAGADEERKAKEQAYKQADLSKKNLLTFHAANGNDVEFSNESKSSKLGWKRRHFSETYTFDKWTTKNREVIDGFKLKQVYDKDGEWTISPTYTTEDYYEKEKTKSTVNCTFFYRVIKKGSQTKIEPLEIELTNIDQWELFLDSTIGTEQSAQKAKKWHITQKLCRWINIVCFSLLTLIFAIESFVPFLKTTLSIVILTLLPMILFFRIRTAINRGSLNYDTSRANRLNVFCIIGYVFVCIFMCIALFVPEIKSMAIGAIFPAIAIIICIVCDCIISVDFNKKYQKYYSKNAIKTGEKVLDLFEKLKNYIIF